MKIQKLIYVVVSLLLFTVNSVADDITLDFEGLKNMEQVQNFYNGGAGSEGSTKGLDYNITFSANTLALIDSDAGGGGNFANEPSPDTTFFFTGNDTNIYMNVEGGFTEGFSFYYTSIQYEGDVEVWTDYNGTGKKIGALHLDITPSLGKGDPYGEYDNWVKKSLSFDGRAKSIVFKGVANQIGFDNITLNPNAKKDIFNHKFNLSKVTHTVKTDIANTFTVYFKDLETTKDSVTLAEICEYNFFVEDKNQNKTKGNELKGNCEVNESKKAFKLNFTITESPYNIEDANVTICKDSQCKKIEDIKNFSIYGTNFDVTKDSFSFENGDWTEYMFIKDKKVTSAPCFKYSPFDCTDTQITYMGKMYNLANALKEFLPNKSKEKAVKAIGYYKTPDKQDKEGGAMCHGLAVSAIANFNNKIGVWGNSLNSSKTENEIISIFKNHWINRDTESAKPFFKKTNNYNIDNFEDAFHSVGKIAYYYVSQEAFTGGIDWVGKHELKELNNINNMNTYHKEFLQKNKVSLFSFDIKHEDGTNGGHSIIATELIQYNTNSIYIFHDNNFRNMFSMLEFTTDFKGFNFRFEKDELFKHYEVLLMGEKYNWTKKAVENWLKVKTFTTPKFNWDYILYKPYNEYVYGFDTFSKETDELHIYGKANSTNTQQKLRGQSSQKVNNTNETFDYSYPNHISITIVGGKLLKVIDRQNQKELVLNPIVGQLEQNKAYLKDNMFLTEFLLPKSSIYKIELQKYKQYPAFEIYAKIPIDDGKVEIINYENLATNQDDSTLAHFLVGNGNSEKGIKREGESDIAPTYDESIDMKLTSVVSINAIVLESGVKLLWQNSVHPNYEESVMVRKEDSIPTSITDGIEIYRGTDEEFLDTTIISEKKYYYAVYAVSKDNEATEPVWTDVDTYRYTLYGTLSDASDEPISGATVTLYNGTKTRLIETSFSANTGLFSFNNLLDGEYVLNFSHPSYTFEKSELNVTVEKKSKEVLMKAEGVANLFMNIPQVVKVGESQTIIWDGIHIDDSATVNIKLFRNNKWETVASNVKYNQHSYKWNVTEPKDENATLKIELSSDATVYSEEKVYIFGADELKYDFDGDGDIDINDIMKVASVWLSKRGDDKFKSEYDYNGDGIIDIKDIMKIASHWGM